MGAVAFQSFHSYIVTKIKTTTHDNPKSNNYATKAEWIDSKTSIDQNPQKHIMSGYEIAIKPCNVNKT